MEVEDIKTIESDARQLLEKILDYTGQVSGKVIISHSSSMRSVFSWRDSISPIRQGHFLYKFERTKQFLVDKGFFTSFKDVTTDSPFYLYKDVLALEVVVDGEKARNFLQKPALVKITERWDKKAGIWIFDMSEGQSIEIKLGTEDTATNKIFNILYQKKNTDVEKSKLYAIGIQNLGRHIAAIRKWIKKDLGEKYQYLASLSLLNRRTATYKLEVNI